MFLDGRHREQLDEQRDVVVQLIYVLDAVTHQEQPNPWSVFVGNEKRRDYATKKEAEDYASQLASELGVLAWILDDTGYPAKRIDSP